MRRVFVGQTGALPTLAARRGDLEYQRVRLRIFKRLLTVGCRVVRAPSRHSTSPSPARARQLHRLSPSRVRKPLILHARIDIQPLVRREASRTSGVCVCVS